MTHRVWTLLAAVGLSFVALLAASSIARAQPAITRAVTDETGIVSPEAITTIEARLTAHHDTGHAQIAILVVHTTHGVPITDYANRAAEAWGGGARGVDDGVLFVLALDDHEMRIEVGYGLEAVLTDAISMRILDQIVPHLRAQRVDAAAWVVSDELIARTGGSSLPMPSLFAAAPMPAPGHPRADTTSEPVREGSRTFEQQRAEEAMWAAQEAREREANTYGFLLLGVFVVLTFGFVVFLVRGSNTTYGLSGARTDWTGMRGALSAVAGVLGAIVVGVVALAYGYGIMLFGIAFVAIIVVSALTGGGSGGSRSGGSRGSSDPWRHSSHKSHRSSSSGGGSWSGGGGGGGGGGKSYSGGGGGFGGGGASKRW